jgi:hypothetical protein
VHPIARAYGLVTNELPDGEAVVYDIALGNYQHLSPTCATVWKLCDGTRSRADITVLAAKTLGADGAGAAVARALRELRERELLYLPEQLSA